MCDGSQTDTKKNAKVSCMVGPGSPTARFAGMSAFNKALGGRRGCSVQDARQGAGKARRRRQCKAGQAHGCVHSRTGSERVRVHGRIVPVSGSLWRLLLATGSLRF